MPESVHEKLARVRKPHVHITYETFKPDGGMEVRELPFVVGVMSDLSGDPSGELKPYKDREFTTIDRDNFDTVMKNMKPGLKLKVKNTLENDGSEINVNLKFDKMADFDPAAVARQVPQLKALLDRREQLHALLNSAERSDKLEGLLEQLLQNDGQIKSIASKMGESKKEAE